jgi:hypothetical protein
MSKTPAELISIDDLQLDPKNPRLPNAVDRTQDAMLEYIAKETSIEELMSVIAENGFFEGEALIAHENPKSKGKYIVIEGNRRLVAVLLLHNPELYPKRKRIQEIAEQAEHKPKKLPVIVYDKREDVLTYLGYRHITGIKQWDPLAKARYMFQLFQQTKKHKSAEDRYKEVAREIGSRRDHIKRSLDGLVVYNVNEGNDFFGIEDLDETSISFSLLTTALVYPAISKLAFSGSDPVADPASINLSNIELLTRWMFERKSGGETILGESRNIGKLASVAESEKALAALKKGKSLDSSYRMTSGVKDEFMRNMYEGQSNLQTANSFVASIKPDGEVMEVANDVVKLARNVVRSLEAADKDDD